MLFTPELKAKLKSKGFECFLQENHSHIPDGLSFEGPSASKFMDMIHTTKIGAFSYGVSGFISEATIGRYCSLGEGVQIGRGGHPTAWMSTSPFFYCGTNGMFDVGSDFSGGPDLMTYHSSPVEYPTERDGRTVPNFLKTTVIGHDVWMGHGAFISQGVTIGTGAVIAGHSVVTKDVPPYAIVGGNPAQIIRFRFSPLQIASLLSLEWWRFAPWDLKNVDYARIDNALEQLRERLPHIKEYDPGFTKLVDLT